MLTPEQLQSIPEPIMKKYRDIENEILASISNTIADELSATGGYQVDTLLRMNKSIEDINKELANRTGRSINEIEKIMEEAINNSYIEEQELYKKGGKSLPNLSDNPMARSFINAGLINTKKDFRNLSNTLGVVSGNKALSLTDYYIDTIDYGIFQMSTGAFTYEQVLDKTMRDLASSGIRSIDYASGYSMNMDVAARQHIRTGLSQITGNISQNNASLMGQDLMEITAHADSRPDHAEWQGQVVSLSGRRGYLSLEDIGYKDVAGFKGANCRHDWFPYFEGISTPSYSLDDLEEANRVVTEWDHKPMTAYDVSQKQRQIERRIRNTKREVAVYEGAGMKEKELFAKAKLQRQNKLYHDFSNSAGIRTKYERI